MINKKNKPAVIFPGQGSQKVGMGKTLYDSHRVAKDVFKLIDETLDFKLSKLIFDGPESELTSTVNTQPALMAVSLALIKVIEFESKKEFSEIASIVCGHSLGEYTSLCSIDSLSISDTALLLSIRGKAMQEAVVSENTNMKAIIGLDINLVEEIINKNISNRVCEIANDNSPGQVVLSGHADQVEKISEICKAKGAKIAIDLNVSAPFHCSLMKPASIIMEDALRKISISETKTRFINNYCAKFEKHPENIKNLLVKQIIGRVRWRETINLISSSGIDNIIEIGPGKVLTGLNKRMKLNLETENIYTLEDVDNFLKKNF
ncbi:ACP S-malonyltransferase [Rickettsiales bacterium]|nr:ACP S-malonyltransferase [Rickettsiales bacterium]